MRGISFRDYNILRQFFNSRNVRAGNERLQIELKSQTIMMLKDILKWSIRMVVLIHVFMLVLNKIPFAVGAWGLAMQLIYYQYLETFPTVNHKSFLFGTTIGKFWQIFVVVQQQWCPPLHYVRTSGEL